MNEEILQIELEDGEVIEMTYNFFNSKSIQELIEITNGRRILGYDIKQ